MLQAMPKTPLHERLARAGRLVDQSVGDQFVFSNILPERMSRAELYRGYRDLVAAQYSFRSFRDRTLSFLLERGNVARLKTRIRSDDLWLLLRILRDTVLRGGARRAWFTLGLLGRTLLRRPSAFADAVSFAVIHKGLADYVHSLADHLNAAIAALEREAAEAASRPGEWEPEAAYTAGSSSAAP
jgi:hypothetical protein